MRESVKEELRQAALRVLDLAKENRIDTACGAVYELDGYSLLAYHTAHWKRMITEMGFGTSRCGRR